MRISDWSSDVCSSDLRVMAGLGNGGLAEKLVVPAGRMFLVPDGVPLEKAASLLMTYGTTVHGLKDRGHIKADDTVLVLGPAGGVGLAALEPYGRASCRERVCTYVYSSVVGTYL